MSSKETFICTSLVPNHRKVYIIVKVIKCEIRRNKHFLSYHLLARNKTRIARNETRIARNETRLAGNENCLARNFSFIASALQVPLLYWRLLGGRIVVCVENRWADMSVSYRWFFPWDKHWRCATGDRYFVAFSGQFLFYMYWSTWWAFVLPVRRSLGWNFSLDLHRRRHVHVKFQASIDLIIIWITYSHTKPRFEHVICDNFLFT